MKINLLFEPDQIVEITRKFMDAGFKLCDGGSISVCDSEGTIYISPEKFDAISTQAKKIVAIDSNQKKYYDIKKASVELPIHSALYDKRSDINAICHVYSPAIAAIAKENNPSIFNLFPRLSKKIGITNFSEYPSNYNTEQVNLFVSHFVDGTSNIIIDGHGVFVTGGTLEEAFEKAELLDHFAKSYINALKHGELQYPDDKSIEKFNKLEVKLPQYLRGRKSGKDMDSDRAGLGRLALYAFQRHFATSLVGTMSIRLSKESYLTVPGNIAKSELDIEKLVMMKHAKSEAWKVPNENIDLHQSIYDNNPNISCISLIFPSACSAYNFTKAQLELEGLKIVKLPFETILDQKAINKSIKDGNDLLIIENDIFIVVTEDMYKMNLIFDTLYWECAK